MRLFLIARAYIALKSIQSCEAVKDGCRWNISTAKYIYFFIDISMYFLSHEDHDVMTIFIVR